jgi:hypothetical protein
MDDDLTTLATIQHDLWDVVNKHLGPEDRSKLLALSGSMMKTAVELYTVILDDNDIEGVLEVVAEDIPKIREKMQEKIGERVLH